MGTPSIMIYSSADGWGGAEKYWYEAVLDPAFRQFDCEAVLPASDVTRARRNELAKLGVKTHLYVRPSGLVSRIKRRLRRWQGRPESAPWYQRLARRKPNLVWFSLGGIGEIGWLEYPIQLCREHGIPYWLIVQHVPEQFFFRDEPSELRGRDNLKAAARVVFISRRNRDVVERAITEKLPNAWLGRNTIRHSQIVLAAETAAKHPVQTPGTARLLNLARFEPEFKGQHILLEVLSDRVWQDRDWHLLLQGGGLRPDQVRRFIAYYGVPADRVAIADRTESVFDVIGRSDALVMPSLSEGTPFAMVECMSAARPAIGTPVGGISDLIDDGKTGWLAESTEPKHFAAAMERAWQGRHRWAEVGQAAQHSVAPAYDLQNNMPEIVQLIRKDARPG